MKQLTRKCIAVLLSVLIIVGAIPLIALAETAQAVEENQGNDSNLYIPGNKARTTPLF